MTHNSVRCIYHNKNNKLRMSDLTIDVLLKDETSIGEQTLVVYWNIANITVKGQ